MLAQTVVDINTEGISTASDADSSLPMRGFWPRGRNVTIVDGYVHCPVDLGDQYDLVKSMRRYSAHAKFLKWKTNEDLRNFVRAWGPLEIVRGASVFPVEAYRAFQRRLKAVANLLVSCGKSCRDGAIACWSIGQQMRPIMRSGLSRRTWGRLHGPF